MFLLDSFFKESARFSPSDSSRCAKQRLDRASQSFARRLTRWQSHYAARQSRLTLSATVSPLTSAMLLASRCVLSWRMRGITPTHRHLTAIASSRLPEEAQWPNSPTSKRNSLSGDMVDVLGKTLTFFVLWKLLHPSILNSLAPFQSRKVLCRARRENDHRAYPPELRSQIRRRRCGSQAQLLVAICGNSICEYWVAIPQTWDVAVSRWCDIN